MNISQRSSLIAILVSCFFSNLTAGYAQPSLAESLIPRYIQGRNGSNTQRIPCAYWVQISGLTGNATYRYFNQVVRSSDSPTTDGAGNTILADPNGFVRTSSPDLSSEGDYGEFTADENGFFGGWMVTEPTGNARFQPGAFIFFRIMLNDGAEGTTVAARLTTADSIQVLKLDTAAADSAGTGLCARTLAAPRDFILLYDNTDGTGRPLAATFVENDGSDNSTSNNYIAFYSDSVNAVDGAFGAIIPNVNNSGVRRVERRSTTADVIAFALSANGQWPSGANTVNPTGGADPIVLTDSDVPLNATDVTDFVGRSQQQSYALLSAYPNPFNASTMIAYDLTQAGHISLSVFDLHGREIAVLKDGLVQAGSHYLNFDGSGLASGIYFARLKASEYVQTKKLTLLK